MKFLPPGLSRHHGGPRLQIFGSACNVGVTLRTSGFAIILMVHGPHVVAVSREHVHHRIFAALRYGQIENAGINRGAMDEEQHRSWRFPYLWRPHALAKHPKRNLTLLRPIFAAPDFAV